MRIIIKGTNIELTKELRAWVTRKLESLAKFDKTLSSKDILSSGKQDHRVDLWVEIGRTTTGQRKGNIFRTEAQMRLRGQSIRVEAIENNLKRSVRKVRIKLRREIKALNEKARVQG